MGETPVIQYHFNWKHVSVIAGLTRTNCLFRFHDGAIRSLQIVEFLKALETAVEEEEKLRFEIKRTEMEIEVWRTEQANERMERKAYGA